MSEPNKYSSSTCQEPGSPGYSINNARTMGKPRSLESFDCAYTYGMRRYFSSSARRKSSMKAVPYSHGSLGGMPWQRLCEVSMPNGIQRRYSSSGVLAAKPPMSWLQEVKPLKPNERPPRRVAAMLESWAPESPPQCSG